MFSITHPTSPTPTLHPTPTPPDPAVHLRLLGISCPLQLHHPHLALRHCGDAEVSRLLFYWLGLGPLPRRERPEGPGQHVRPQRRAGAGMTPFQTTLTFYSIIILIYYLQNVFFFLFRNAHLRYEKKNK